MDSRWPSVENRRDGKAGVPALDEEGQKELIQDVLGSREEPGWLWVLGAE